MTCSLEWNLDNETRCNYLLLYLEHLTRSIKPIVARHFEKNKKSIFIGFSIQFYKITVCTKIILMELHTVFCFFTMRWFSSYLWLLFISTSISNKLSNVISKFLV